MSDGVPGKPVAEINLPKPPGTPAAAIERYSTLSAWGRYAGIAATVAVFVPVELLSKTPFAVPNPGAIYMLAVAFATFAGGIVPGLASAAIATAGTALHFLSAAQFSGLSRFDYSRLVVLAIAATGLAVLVGVLRRRLDAVHESIRVATVLEATNHVELAAKTADAQRDAILKTVPVGISFLRDRRHVWINEAYSEISGFARNEIIGQTTGILYAAEREYERVGREAYPVLAQGAAYSEELQIVRKDGERRWVRVTGRAIESSDLSKGSIWVMEDISEIKRANDERLAQERKQRDVLLREVHHRIKNHLQGVIGLLAEHESNHPELRHAIGAIVGQIFSIAVVHGLHGRMGSHDVIVCDLVSEIARGSAALVNPGLEMKVEIRVPAPVKVRQEQAVPIALILNELILNACKHGCAPIIASVACETDEVLVTVRNRCGSGAAPRDTTTCDWFGTGLGIVRLLVPQHGATLTFSSRAGEFIARLALRAPVIGE